MSDKYALNDKDIIAAQEKEIKRLHIALAGETLRANQGWERYEAANKSHIALLAEKVAHSDAQVAQVPATIYQMATSSDGKHWFDCSKDTYAGLPPEHRRIVYAAQPTAAIDAGNWQQYAKEGESAQDVIERERKDNDALLTLLAREKSAASDVRDKDAN